MKSKMNTTRLIGGDEMLGSAHSLYERLCGAVSACDQNRSSPLGVPNMAIPIRALVCSGHGNRLIQRICKELNLPLPKFRCSTHSPGDFDTMWIGAVPEEPRPDCSPDDYKDIVDELIALGAVRCDAPKGLPCHRPPIELTLDEWLDRVCIRCDHEHERVALSWDNFLRGLAEKRGYIHTDQQVPEYFSTVDSLTLMGAKAADFLYRTAAGAICHGTFEVLTYAGCAGLTIPPTWQAPNAGATYGFGFRGILAPTRKQNEMWKKVQEAIADPNPETAASKLYQLSEEMSSYASLYYVRLRAVIHFELAGIDARCGRMLSASLAWSQIVQAYHGSDDSHLNDLAAKANAQLAATDGF